MKSVSALFFILLANLSFGQDTLREQDSHMYGRYYVLFETGEFEFHFHHCTGQTLAFGEYIMTKSGISFEYDSIPEPKPKVVSSTDQTDSISVQLFDISDSSRIEFFKVLNKEKREIVFDGEFKVHKDQVKKTLIVNHFSDTIEIQINPDHNNYKIFILPTYISFTYFGIEKMKKKKDYFVHKVKVVDPIEEEPWKKGKTRTVLYVYRVESGT